MFCIIFAIFPVSRKHRAVTRPHLVNATVGWQRLLSHQRQVRVIPTGYRYLFRYTHRRSWNDDLGGSAYVWIRPSPRNLRQQLNSTLKVENASRTWCPLVKRPLHSYPLVALTSPRPFVHPCRRASRLAAREAFAKEIEGIRARIVLLWMPPVRGEK